MCEIVVRIISSTFNKNESDIHNNDLARRLAFEIVNMFGLSFT